MGVSRTSQRVNSGEGLHAHVVRRVLANTDPSHRVTGIADWENQLCRVLPFGVEIPIRAEVTEDGLERLREADAQQQKTEG